MSKGNKKEHKCPVCNANAQTRSVNRFFPFCSARCKQVDLGRWLNEEYRITVSEEMTERDLSVTLTEDV